MNLKNYSFLLFLILSFLTGCSDDPTGVGGEMLPKDDLKNLSQYDSYKMNSPQKSSGFRAEQDYGYSERAILGKANSMESRVLLDFSMTVPDSLLAAYNNKKLSVVSARLILKPTYSIGEASAPFDFSVNKITSSWTSVGFSTSSLSSISYEASDKSDSKTITDSLITVNLNKDFVSSWVDYKMDSTKASPVKGLYLIPSASTGRAIGFPAVTLYTLANVAAVSVTYLNSNGTTAYQTTVTYGASYDTHVVFGDTPKAPQGEFILEGGIPMRGKLAFDISSIPAYSMINKAYLELSTDSLKASFGSISSDTIYARAFTDSSSCATDTRVMSLVRSGSKYSGDISTIVQLWVNAALKNEGLRIELSDDSRSLNKLFVYGSQAQDATKRPRLQIFYSSKR